MNTNQAFGRVLVVSALLATLAVAQPASAAVVVRYTFDRGTTGTLVELLDGSNQPLRVNVNPGVAEVATNGGAQIVNVSAWTTENPGTLFNAPGTIQIGLDPNLGNPDDGALGASGWQAGNAFLFQFDVAPGWVLDLEDFSFLEQRSGGANGNGPSNWSLFANGAGTAQATGGTTNGAAGLRSGSFTGLDGLTATVAFRLFATGASAASATWRVDNFTLNGTLTAVPVPPAALLLGSALGALRLRRRGG